jgi:nucleotide-binding universal stress UspA family protein
MPPEAAGGYRTEVAMYQVVLVPLDGSKRAEAILPHVEELAGRHQAQVVLLQVIELVSDVSYMAGASFDLSQGTFTRWTTEAEDYLSSIQGKFREKGIETRTRVEIGPVVETIITVAEGEGADLIAMASHGRTGLSRVFYGSMAAGVLQRVDRPLLLIRS